MAAVTNILLDLLFVVGFGWSVEGAAWATVAARALSAVLILVYFLRKAKGLILKRSHCRIDKQLLGSIVTNSMLTAVQQSIMNFGILNW